MVFNALAYLARYSGATANGGRLSANDKQWMLTIYWSVTSSDRRTGDTVGPLGTALTEDGRINTLFGMHDTI